MAKRHPLFEAVRAGDLAQLEASWEPEAASRVVAEDGTTLLMEAAYRDPTGDLVDFLIRHGADLDVQDDYGNTALFLAVNYRRLENARRLLEAGADPAIREAEGDGPLIRASSNGDVEMARLLVAHDPDAEIAGLHAFPEDERPDPRIVHLAFQVMVGLGFALVGLSLWYWGSAWRRRGRAAGRDGAIPGTGLLLAVLAGSPMGFLALQAGWLVTEVGRQPWVIYGVKRTEEAVTPVGDVPFTLLGFAVLYLVLGAALDALLRGLARHRHGAPPEPLPREEPAGA